MRRRRKRPSGVRRSSFAASSASAASTPELAVGPLRVGLAALLGPAAHRPELDHPELVAVEADARLAEEDRPAHRHEDTGREEGEDRQEEQQEEGRGDPVERVLAGHRETPGVRGARGEERDPADVVDGEALGRPLEEPRHEGHLDAEGLAALGQAEEDLVRRRREGDEDVLDFVLGDGPLEIPARSEDGHRVGAVERLLVEEPDRLQPELRAARGGGAASVWPTRPAPRMSVGRSISPRRRARVSARERTTRPATAQTVAKSQGRTAWDEGMAASEAITRAVTTRHRRDGRRADDLAKLAVEPAAEAWLVRSPRAKEDEREEREGREPDDRRRGKAGRAPAGLGEGDAHAEHRGVDREAAERPLGRGR